MISFFKKKQPSESAEEIIVEPVATPSNWLGKLRQGLSKSSERLNEGMKNIFVRQKLDDAMLEELEELLIMADLGVKASSDIVQHIAKQKYDKSITLEEVQYLISNYLTNILEPVSIPLAISPEHKPEIILMCGVNGTGKTTSIGKLTKQLQAQGKSVMLAACDTFRAAAVEQLKVWAERNQCPIITGDEGADPASVAYRALEQAQAASTDVLLIDTAGRLQNKAHLMEQLTKVVRVIKKQNADAPHHCIIVLDATTGQNANSQVKLFNEAVSLTGMMVTKLDGTAKGGVVVSLANEFKLPIHAVGVGEGIDDMQAFDAEQFAKSFAGIGSTS